MGKSKQSNNIESHDAINIVMRYPKGNTFGLGIFLLSVTAIMATIILSSRDINIFFACLIFVVTPMCLLGGSYICLYYNWEISIIDNEIYYRNLLRQEKYFKIEQIEHAIIKRKKAVYEMYVYSKDKKLFSLFTFCFGYSDFLHLLKIRNVPIKRLY